MPLSLLIFVARVHAALNGIASLHFTLHCLLVVCIHGQCFVIRVQGFVLLFHFVVALCLFDMRLDVVGVAFQAFVQLNQCTGLLQQCHEALAFVALRLSTLEVAADGVFVLFKRLGVFLLFLELVSFLVVLV